MNRTSHKLLGIQNGVENSLTVSLNMHLSNDRGIPFLGIRPREIKLLFAPELYTDINSSSSHNYHINSNISQQVNG